MAASNHEPADDPAANLARFSGLTVSRPLAYHGPTFSGVEFGSGDFKPSCRARVRKSTKGLARKNIPRSDWPAFQRKLPMFPSS